MKKDLTQTEIDAVFRGLGASDPAKDGQTDIQPFDFNRLERIPKSQLQALHLVHENFCRSLASSLSAYLRSYSVLNLVSLEQITYQEFLEGLASPTCIAYLAMSPYDGTAVLELSTSLVFGLIELLLGSKGRSSLPVQRKITDIEKRLVQTLLRVVLRDLTDAWKSVAEVEFAVQSLSSEPQLLNVIAPTEAVIVIAIEVRAGAAIGLMNLAIPSIFIKRLRSKFEQLQKIRKVESTTRDQRHIAQILHSTKVTLEVQIPAGVVSAKTLMDLEQDDVLVLDHPIEREVTGTLNGKDKWLGHIVVKNDRMTFELKEQIKFPASAVPSSAALS
jgi:flagellar motor switch protein FliM